MKSQKWPAIVVFFLIIRIEGQRQTTTCGRHTPPPEPFITIGDPATQHWPWHAAIYHRVNGTVPTYKCGGTVINSDMVLTAGHCVSKNNWPMKTNQVRISLGRLNLGIHENVSAQWFEVAEIILHSNFTAIDLNNDIAIVRLSTVAIFNSYVEPICLWRSELPEMIDGRNGIVVGWGMTEMNETSNPLRQAALTVVGFHTCLDSNRNFFGRFLRTTNYCAGNRNGTSVCFGDSGGSMTFEENGIHYIRGIVSTGPAIYDPAEPDKKVCDTSQYSLYTDVAKYLTWIEDTVTQCRIDAKCMELNSLNRLCKLEQIVKPSVPAENCKLISNEIASEVVEVTILRMEGELDTLPDLSNAITNYPNLEMVDLNFVKLRHLQRTKLAAFGRITSMKWSVNDVLQIDAETFYGLKNLKWFTLYAEKLTELHADIFKELHNLTHITLSSLAIGRLPSDIFRNNQKLLRIQIDHTRLKELHVDLFKELPYLVGLSLNANKLETLPADIFRNNRELREISIERNQIKVLHADIVKELPNLTILEFNRNNIEILPADIFRNNKKLREIYLQQNQLKELHADVLEDLPNLTTLQLNGNQLEILPAEIFQNNKKLRDIHLDGNKIKKIECDFPNSIDHLYLRGNVCIDEHCSYYESFCGAGSLLEMNQKLHRQCQ